MGRFYEMCGNREVESSGRKRKKKLEDAASSQLKAKPQANFRATPGLTVQLGGLASYYFIILGH